MKNILAKLKWNNVVFKKFSTVNIKKKLSYKWIGPTMLTMGFINHEYTKSNKASFDEKEYLKKLFNSSLSTYIIYPKTKSIFQDLENQSACIFEYDENFKFSLSDKDILEHPSIDKGELRLYIKEILKHSFP